MWVANTGSAVPAPSFSTVGWHAHAPRSPFKPTVPKITTIEGLAKDQGLDGLREAFSRHGALQCGFCTPGVLASTAHYLESNPDPNEEDIREMLSGHLCRCTGYEGMVRAILEFAAIKRNGAPE